MARTDNLTNFLTDVANAIRNKTGETEEILASEFDNKIEAIEIGGGSGDISEYFDTSVVSTMSSYIMNRMLKKIPVSFLQELGQKKITNMSYMFYYCNNLESIDFGENFDMSNTTNMSYMFQSCSKLTTVSKLNASKVNMVNSMFALDSYLTNLGGLENLGEAYLTTTAANYNNYTLNLNACTRLTHESLMNVINGLYDIASKGCKAQSLVLGATNIAKLSEEEIAIATEKGWTVS